MLEVPVAEGPAVEIPHIKLFDFATVLLKRHPKLLFGGLPLGDDSRQVCKSFWEKFQLYQPEHALYETYTTPDEWQYVLPIMVHGDKGRGRAKLPVLVLSFESCFGLLDKVRQAGPGHATAGVHGGRLAWHCGKRKRSQCPDLDEPGDLAEACELHESCKCQEPLKMLHNGRGHSFLTKFLVAAIPHKVFSTHPEVFPALLHELKDNLIRLFTTGVDHDGHNYKFALVGVKGDLEFHHEAAVFKHCYLNVGVRNDLLMCPECSAGDAAHPYTDFRDNPAWLATCHQSTPWLSTPPLSLVPFSSTRPATLYRRDCFHNLKYGLFKDVGACMLIELCTMGLFDTDSPESQSLPKRLQRAYSYFRLWLLTEKKHCTLRKFTLANLHRTRANNFPFLGGKGADSVLLFMFFDFFLPLGMQNQQPETVALLKAMLETVRGGLNFVGVHHSHGLFLSEYCAEFLFQSGLRFLRGYGYLADRSIRAGKRHYSLRPKLHYFHHTLMDLKAQLSAGHKHILNPIFAGCEANEDFIGRVSRLARKVSPKIAMQRTLDRYLVGVMLLMRKHGV